MYSYLLWYTLSKQTCVNVAQFAWRYINGRCINWSFTCWKLFNSGHALKNRTRIYCEICCNWKIDPQACCVRNQIHRCLQVQQWCQVGGLTLEKWVWGNIALPHNMVGRYGLILIIWFGVRFQSHYFLVGAMQVPDTRQHPRHFSGWVSKRWLSSSPILSHCTAFLGDCVTRAQQLTISLSDLIASARFWPSDSLGYSWILSTVLFWEACSPESASKILSRKTLSRRWKFNFDILDFENCANKFLRGHAIHSIQHAWRLIQDQGL